MTTNTLTVRYVTRPGSNVGAYRGRHAGRTHQRTADQRVTGEENARAVAETLVTRAGVPGVTVGKLVDQPAPGRYVFALAWVEIGGPR